MYQTFFVNDLPIRTLLAKTTNLITMSFENTRVDSPFFLNNASHSTNHDRGGSLLPFAAPPREVLENITIEDFLYYQGQAFQSNFNGSPFELITVHEFPGENDAKLMMIATIVAAVIYLLFVIYALFVILRDDETKNFLRGQLVQTTIIKRSEPAETRRIDVRTTITATSSPSSSSSSPEKIAKTKPVLPVVPE